MLAESYLANGRWAEYVKTVDGLDRLQAVTPEDHLFKGVAIRALAPELALRSIAEAVRMRSAFTLARVWRANAQVFLAALVS